MKNLVGDIVYNDEILYRRVLYDRKHYKIDQEKGIVRISSQAFADRTCKPSVDRAKLCNFDPTHTQKEEKCAVVSLLTYDIRMIDAVIERDKNGNEVERHRIDVIPDEMENNKAHALIVPDPAYRKPKQVFRKLLEALVRLSSEQEWKILPWELRTKV